MKDIKHVNNLLEPLNNDQIVKLILEYKNGSLKARNKIIEHNMRLIVKRIYDRFYRADVDGNELLSIGCIGLMKAIDSFDMKRTTSFANYAIKCIDTEILCFLRDRRKDDCLISLETTIKGSDDGKDQKLEDVISDKNDLIENYENKVLKKVVKEKLEELDEKTQNILKLYYGFQGKCYTQREIADKLNVSRTTICNIIEKGVEQLSSKLVQDEYLYMQKREKKVIQRKNLLELLNINSDELENRLELLSDEDKNLLKLHYSDGFDKITNSKLDSTQKNYVYKKIIPKLQPEKICKRGVSLCELLGATKDEMESVISQLCKYHQILIRMRYPEGVDKRVFNKISPGDVSSIYMYVVPLLQQGLKNQNIVKYDNNNNDLSVEQIVNLDYFKDLAIQIGVKRALVLSLTFGYIDNINYDENVISSVLGISKKDALNIIRTCILKYKQYLDEYQKPIEKIR